ncbi:MAG: hypothetical protein AAGK32_22220, partial [Actinomycetota bacterium]
MTTVQQERTTPVADPDPPGEEAPKARRVTWRSVLFTLILIPSALAVPYLGWRGAEILRNEDTGQVVDAVQDSSEPGFQALVTPTPTQLLVARDDTGRVAGVQVLALSDPSGGGTLVSIPVSTNLEVAFLDTPTKP